MLITCQPSAKSVAAARLILAKIQRSLAFPVTIVQDVQLDFSQNCSYFPPFNNFVLHYLCHTRKPLLASGVANRAPTP
jgi:hypothetical protein